MRCHKPLKWVTFRLSQSAVGILLNYMIFSSPILITLLILAFIISIPSFIMETLTLKIRTGLNHITEKVMKNIFKIAIKIISNEGCLEKLSYETDLLHKKTMKAA